MPIVTTIKITKVGYPFLFGEGFAGVSNLNFRIWPFGDAGREAERTAALRLSGRFLDFGVSFGYKISYGAF